MLDVDFGQTHTAHTLNPFPLILVSEQPDSVGLKNGRLCDIAPTLLHMLSLPISSEMAGMSLLTV
jgi:2,3-bisphosphoglycerate-independent phosphoglycerate mutase